MKTKLFVLSIICFALILASTIPNGGRVLVDYASAAGRGPIYDDNADGRELISKAVDQANKEGKRVVIAWGADWCGWCQSLDRYWHGNAEINKLAKNNYVSIHVSLRHRDKHMDLAREYGLEFNVLKIPHLTILGEDGKPIAQKQPKELIGDTDHGRDWIPELIVKFLKEHRKSVTDPTKPDASAKDR